MRYSVPNSFVEFNFGKVLHKIHFFIYKSIDDIKFIEYCEIVNYFLKKALKKSE